MSARFTHVVACQTFLSQAEYYSCVCIRACARTHHSLHSFVSGLVGSVHLSANGSSSAVHARVQVSETPFQLSLSFCIHVGSGSILSPGIE